MKRTYRKQIGFTLIELLVTIAVVAVLLGIAIPSYERYTIQTKRAGVKTTVERVRGLLEQYYVNNKNYTDDLTNLGLGSKTVNVSSNGDIVAAGTPDIVYLVSVNTSAMGTIKYCATCQYEVVATPQFNQAKLDTDCLILWFGSTGQKSATGPKGSKCW